MEFGLHISFMIKTKIDEFEFWNIKDIKICFISPLNGVHNFYVKSSDIFEEAISEYIKGNLITLDMIFLNVN